MWGGHFVLQWKGKQVTSSVLEWTWYVGPGASYVLMNLLSPFPCSFPLQSLFSRHLSIGLCPPNQSQKLWPEMGFWFCLASECWLWLAGLDPVVKGLARSKAALKGEEGACVLTGMLPQASPTSLYPNEGLTKHFFLITDCLWVNCLTHAVASYTNYQIPSA